MNTTRDLRDLVVLVVSCKRLRLAVVSTYINVNLDLMSFYRLTNDPSLRNRLTDLAKETKKGRGLITLVQLIVALILKLNRFFIAVWP